MIPGVSPDPRARPIVFLFATTTFVASALVFLVEPMFAKMVLPRLGGSPAVWNTCVLFFQATLLLGYLYAHLTTRWLGARRQAVAHLVLMAAALAFLPLTLGDGYPRAGSDPVWWLLVTMVARLGLPFLAVSTMAPLVQRWFATMPVPSASNPYFLYAASNIGSMLALLSYPFVLEPFWGTQFHTRLWQAGYVVLLALTGACALGAARMGHEVVRPSHAPTAISWSRRARWTALAAIPSSLMLGVTTHISTDLAAMPLLWVLPLAAYLLTFVLAFSTRVWIGDKPLARALPLLALVVVVSVTLQLNAPFLIPVHLLAFFVAALVCHLALVRLKPGAEDLTEFYVWMSFGGMLGGVFNSLIAPYIFNGVFEYPIVLALACLVRPSPAYRRGTLEPWGLLGAAVFVPLFVCAGAWAVGRTPPGADLGLVLLIGSTAPALFFAIANRTAAFNAIVVAAAVIITVGGSTRSAAGALIFAGRSFFGVSRVVQGPHDSYHLLQHGSTLHGRQNRPAGSLCEPQSYYGAAAPVGQLFRASGLTFSSVAVVGLGSGGLACYADAGSRWTFVEIDPLVEDIARDPRLFTFLQNAAGRIGVEIGDGRRKLEEAAPAAFDLIVIDAFTSDTVPAHLMTTEAWQMYLTRLAPDGVIALHISNRYVNLEPVVAANAAVTHVFALTRLEAQVPAEELARGRTPSQWVVVTPSPERLRALGQVPGWRPLVTAVGVHAWTDDYSNLLKSIRW